MAIAVLVTPEGMDRATFEKVRGIVEGKLGPHPAGRLFNCCFGEEGALRVFDIWDSEQSLSTFGATLGPALQQNGVKVASRECTPIVLWREPGYIERLRAAHDTFNSGDHDATAQFVAEDFQLTDHGKSLTCGSRAEFRGWLDGHRAMSSDMTLVDRTYLASGDWVIARFRAVGHQDGPLGPFPATGKPFSLDVCEVWRFNEDGLAVEGADYSDGMSLAASLGHLPVG